VENKFVVYLKGIKNAINSNPWKEFGSKHDEMSTPSAMWAPSLVNLLQSIMFNQITTFLELFIIPIKNIYMLWYWGLTQNNKSIWCIVNIPNLLLEPW
jgi:hypothetical protein